MFMVTYPWPVASAHVDLTGTQRPESAAPDAAATEDTVEQRSRHLEATVSWTGRERLRIHWYRLHLAARDIYRGSLRG
jgi:hypothetical protein